MRCRSYNELGRFLKWSEECSKVFWVIDFDHFFHKYLQKQTQSIYSIYINKKQGEHSHIRPQKTSMVIFFSRNILTHKTVCMWRSCTLFQLASFITVAEQQSFADCMAPQISVRNKLSTFLFWGFQLIVWGWKKKAGWDVREMTENCPERDVRCRSGFGWRRLARCSVAGAELWLGNVSQGALDLFQQHVAAVNHLLQTGRCVVVLLLQLPETGRLTRGHTVIYNDMMVWIIYLFIYLQSCL